MESKLSKYPNSLVMLLSGWVVYTAIYFALQSGELTKHYSGLLLFIGDSSISIIGSIYAVWLWLQTKGSARRVIGFLALSFCCIAITSVVYHVTNYVLQIPHEHRSSFVASLCNIPYLGYLIFQILMFGFLFLQGKAFKKYYRFSSYIPALIITAILLFVLVSQLPISPTTSFLSSFYDVSGKILEIIGFIMAVFGVAISKNKGFFFISLGFLIAQGSDLIIDYGVFSQQYGIGSIWEALWVLFYLFLIYGTVNLKQTGAYLAEPKDWISPADSIRSQTTFWSFILCTSLLAVFSSAAYLFSGKVFF